MRMMRRYTPKNSPASHTNKVQACKFSDTTHRERIRTVGVVHRVHPARVRVQEAPVLRRGRVRRGRPSVAPPPNVVDVAVIPVAIAGCRKKQSLK